MAVGCRLAERLTPLYFVSKERLADGGFGASRGARRRHGPAATMFHFRVVPKMGWAFFDPAPTGSSF